MVVPSKRPGQVAEAFYYAVLGVFYLLLLCHRSEDPIVFNYSFRYLVYLFDVALLFFIPYAWARFYPHLRPYLFQSIALGSILYLIASGIYYHNQKHLFDPFLQMPNIRYDASLPKKPGTFRILCLGGSTTRCVGLSIEQKYPSVLQDLLQRAYPGRKIEVLNAGSGWFTTKHSLISYVTYYRYWEPDIVIVMHGINDLARSFSPPEFSFGGYRDSWGHYYGAAINGALPPPFEKAWGQYVWKAVEPALRSLSSWTGKHHARPVEYPDARFVSLAMFERHLGALLSAVKMDGALPVVVSEAAIYKRDMTLTERSRLWFGPRFCATRTGFAQVEYPSFRTMARGVDLFSTVARAVAQEKSALFIDAAGRLPKTQEIFTDDCHYTAKGSLALASLVAYAIIHTEAGMKGAGSRNEQ